MALIETSVARLVAVVVVERSLATAVEALEAEEAAVLASEWLSSLT